MCVHDGFEFCRRDDARRSCPAFAAARAAGDPRGRRCVLSPSRGYERDVGRRSGRGARHDHLTVHGDNHAGHADRIAGDFFHDAGISLPSTR